MTSQVRQKKLENKYSYTLKDTYSFYKKAFLEVSDNNRTIIPKSVYFKCLKEIFKEIGKQCIINKTPYNPKIMIGRLGVVRKDRKVDPETNKVRAPINWKATKKLGKHVYYKNNHTNGASFRWHWEKTKKCIFKNKSFYHFSPVRGMQLFLNEHIFALDAAIEEKPYDTFYYFPNYENKFNINSRDRQRVEKNNRLGY